ncbi:hypothetical protein Tco_1409936 [Tanacetum coccineum]
MIRVIKPKNLPQSALMSRETIYGYSTSQLLKSTGSRGAIEKKLRKMKFGIRFGMASEFCGVVYDDGQLKTFYRRSTMFENLIFVAGLVESTLLTKFKDIYYLKVLDSFIAQDWQKSILLFPLSLN